MRKFFIFITSSLIAFCASAETIVCSPGQLSSLVTDKDVTSLQLSGAINALDFKYIADNLKQLQSLDIANCNIDAYSSNKALFGNAHSFKANEIPATCFAGSTISQFVLPASLKSIGEGAFACCNGIEAITLPAEVDSIAAHAFSACQHLSAIVLPAKVTVVGEGAFAHCTSLAKLTIDDEGRTENIVLGSQSFVNCTSLAEVTLGSMTQSIGSRAFSGCSNADFAVAIAAKSQLSEIGEGAFMASGIKAFNFANCPKLTVIPEYAFATSSLTEVAIPETVKHIGEGAFFYGTDIATISLADCSASISNLQFAGCNNASSTGLDDSTNEIGKYAYYGWDKTEKLVLPEAVAYVGDHAFANMKSLAKITSKNPDAPQLGEAVFEGVTPSEVRLTTRPDALGYATAEQWKDFIHTLNGDADNNTRININDIATIISHLNGKTPSNFIFEAADANVDDIVNNSDLNDVLNIIVSSEPKQETN